MSKNFILFVVLLSSVLLLSSCGGETAETASASVTSGVAETETYEKTEPDGEKIINSSVVFAVGEEKIIVRGEEFTMETSPFTENGVTYVPASACVYISGASFVESGDVYRINSRGNVTLAMADYNVILFNNESVVMASTPVIRDGIFCLPAEGLAASLSMSYSSSRDGTLCLFGNMGRVSESDLSAVAKAMGRSLGDVHSEELYLLAESFGADYEDAAAAALYGELWSCSDGYASKYTLTSTGELKCEKIPVNAEIPEGILMFEKNGELYRSGGKTPVSKTPHSLHAEELKDAAARYMELLAASHLSGDVTAETLSGVYLRAVGGELKDEEYLLDKASPYETGLYGNSSGEVAFQRLFDAAEVGDVLTFSATDAGAEYGFFNHCALIIEKNEDTGKLRLLQARGFEYGVGADLEMDQLSFESFDEIDYYKGYSTVFLLKYNGLSSSEKESLASAAYEKYNGYAFGYGGRMGLSETNCTELVDEAYLEVGVDLVDGDYESRLKEVLKGNTKNLVLIPDDLLFSGNLDVVAVFVR